MSRRIPYAFMAILTAVSLTLPAITMAANEGDLIKTQCGENAAADDQCRAVYYLGVDGQRHLFPNADVYFSWYDDFNDVVIISSDEMNGYEMGKNVTLKPGTSVIKFATDDAIYAVAEGGVLRHYLTPQLVAADYGDDWYKNDLVIMSDTFFNDYRMGQDIDSNDDYDPKDAESGVISIDDNF